MVKWLFRILEDGALETDNPPFSMVKDAINALDGNEINTVSLKLRNDDSMDIGGGKANQYKCHVRTKNGFYHLLNPNCQRDMNDTVPIVMGDGEEWNYPKCTIVSLETVMIAVECFCTTGELSPNLTWDKTLDFKL